MATVTVPVMGDRPPGGTREPADLAIRNGKVYTGDAASPSTSAVAITGGVFTAVGDDDAVARYVRSTTRIPSCRSWLSLHWLTTGRGIGGNPLDAQDSIVIWPRRHGASREPMIAVSDRRDTERVLDGLDAEMFGCSGMARRAE